MGKRVVVTSRMKCGKSGFIEECTVDVHIRRLRKALDVVAKDKLVQTVCVTGYRFSIENESIMQSGPAVGVNSLIL